MNRKFSFNNIIGSISKLISDEDVVERKTKKSQQQKANDEEIQNAILVLAAEVIRRDGNYTSDTEKFIRDFFAAQFGGTGLSHRMGYMNDKMETGTEPFLRIACKELKMLTTHDSRINIVHFLFGVAAVDDFINVKETRCIHRIASNLGVSEKEFKEVKQNFVSENNPFKFLGVQEDATDAEIRLAYRKMVLKFHPDKRGKDIGEEEANIKFREIQRAFDTIKKQRN